MTRSDPPRNNAPDPRGLPANYGLSLPSGYYALGVEQPHRPLDRPDLGRIVECGYFHVPPADPVTAIVSDRSLTTGLGLDDAIQRIRQRYEIYRHHVTELEASRQRALSAAQSWHAPQGWIESGRDPTLETTLRELDQQQREQRVSLWRDVGRLRDTLPTWIQDYLSASRRRQWLNGRGEEL